MNYTKYDIVCIMDYLYHIPGTNITQGDLVNVVNQCKTKKPQVIENYYNNRKYQNVPLSRPKRFKTALQNILPKKKKVKKTEHFGFNNQIVNFLLIIFVVILVLNFVK